MTRKTLASALPFDTDSTELVEEQVPRLLTLIEAAEILNEDYYTTRTKWRTRGWIPVGKHSNTLLFEASQIQMRPVRAWGRGPLRQRANLVSATEVARRLHLPVRALEDWTPTAPFWRDRRKRKWFDLREVYHWLTQTTNRLPPKEKPQ
jgi:hypothetical protein